MFIIYLFICAFRMQQLWQLSRVCPANLWWQAVAFTLDAIQFICFIYIRTYIHTVCLFSICRLLPINETQKLQPAGHACTYTIYKFEKAKYNEDWLIAVEGLSREIVMLAAVATSAKAAPNCRRIGGSRLFNF